ncbi:MAG: hypothetical protein KKF12_12395 [Proteobacteria bacterium]|nr:hypothetical protein [Desulfobacula sp.]MBU3953817.1 hypothetical protein [Pseudomonadota bacterium]MBU4131612.1 hypothetical protein [Pseudomonadota bacterium]
MDSMNLNDYRNDPSRIMEEDTSENLQSSEYRQEINTLKIEKLANRVTLISVIIPCLICAILIFIYLDMKERVVDVDETKRIQVEKIAQQLEEKLNALDVRIAKNKFELDQQLPVLSKKQETLETQLTKLSSSKADAKTMETAMAKLGEGIQKNTSQNKSNQLALEAVNVKFLASIKENNAQFKENADQIKEEISLFKKKFDSGLAELRAYEEQLGQLGKTTSLLDKKFKAMELEKLSGKELDSRFNQMQQSFERKIKELETKLAQRTSSSPAPVKTTDKTQSSDTKPSPQLDTGNIKSGNISEQPLKQ